MTAFYNYYSEMFITITIIMKYLSMHMRMYIPETSDFSIIMVKLLLFICVQTA